MASWNDGGWLYFECTLLCCYCDNSGYIKKYVYALIALWFILQASKYLESQISSEPLWSRSASTSESHIKLIPITTNTTTPQIPDRGDKPEKSDDVIKNMKDESVVIDSKTVYSTGN